MPARTALKPANTLLALALALSLAVGLGCASSNNPASTPNPNARVQPAATSNPPTTDVRTTTSGNPKLLDDAVIDSIVEGTTTSAQVRSLLGEPDNITTDAEWLPEGWSMWIYAYASTTLTFSGNDVTNTTINKARGLGVGFDQNGVVQTKEVHGGD